MGIYKRRASKKSEAKWSEMKVTQPCLITATPGTIQSMQILKAKMLNWCAYSPGIFINCQGWASGSQRCRWILYSWATGESPYQKQRVFQKYVIQKMTKNTVCLRNGLCDLHYYFTSEAHKLQFLYASFALERFRKCLWSSFRVEICCFLHSKMHNLRSFNK